MNELQPMLCPHCGTELKEFDARKQPMGNFVVFMAGCGGQSGCRKLLSFQVLGEVAPQVEIPRIQL